VRNQRERHTALGTKLCIAHQRRSTNFANYIHNFPKTFSVELFVRNFRTQARPQRSKRSRGRKRCPRLIKPVQAMATTSNHCEPCQAHLSETSAQDNR